VRRLLVSSTALLWGLQFSLLNPALALVLVALYGASAVQVGEILAVYNASGFVASLALPAYADRRHDYLRPMLACGILTLALAGLLASTRSLPVAVVGLVLLGGPAGVGVSLLFAHLKDAGASRSDVVHTRAVFSFAWVAGPPLATVVISASGTRTVLLVIAAVAVLATTSTAALLRRHRGAHQEPPPAAVQPTTRDAALSRAAIVVVVVAFVALQASNSAAVSVMTLFVTRTLQLDVGWAGAALGLAAALEVPALLLIGRYTDRVADVRIIAGGSVLGIAYYAGMAYATGPAVLLALQVLNAAFFAAVAGVGISLFQRVIPRPGLASGLYTNTRRIGAIASGPVIPLGAIGRLGGYRSVFGACSLLTALALLLLLTLPWRRKQPEPSTSPSRATFPDRAPSTGPRPTRWHWRNALSCRR
jgi:SET family sugar efflux transporter-like MFS transporter